MKSSPKNTMTRSIAFPAQPAWVAQTAPAVLATLATWATLAALAALALTGCGREKTSRLEQAVPVSVRVQALAVSAEPGLVEAVGSLRAWKEATVSGKVMGTVTEIRKHAGDPVRQGETLLAVDARDVSGQIAQAEGGLAQARAAAVLAETNFHRFEQLLSRGSASQLELDQARYQYETAKGAVEQAEGAVATAKSYQAYAVIPAPFSGLVVDQLCEVGDMAAPGRPLMTVEDPSHLRLFASLDATRSQSAVVGSAISVRVPSAEGRIFPARITEVVPAADPATRSILVKIDLEPASDLRPGMFATALLPAGERQVLRVPNAAVVHRGGITGVFVAEAGHAAFRMVVLAGSSSDPERSEVLSGLSAGDQTIIDPPAGLEVGAPVEVHS
jgi:RND family efflux transporter MFP subunit